MTNIAWTHLRSIEDIKGDDVEDEALLRSMYDDALEYIQSFPWCQAIRGSYFGYGIGGLIACYLLCVEVQRHGATSSEWLWVLVGDLPSCYMVSDDINSPKKAVSAYCDLMVDWVDAVRRGADLSDVFPVEAQANGVNATSLQKRIDFIRTNLINKIDE